MSTTRHWHSRYFISLTPSKSPRDTPEPSPLYPSMPSRWQLFQNCNAFMTWKLISFHISSKRAATSRDFYASPLALVISPSPLALVIWFQLPINSSHLLFLHPYLSRLIEQPHSLYDVLMSQAVYQRDFYRLRTNLRYFHLNVSFKFF